MNVPRNEWGIFQNQGVNPEDEILKNFVLRISNFGSVWELFFRTNFYFLEQKIQKTSLIIKNCFLFYVLKNIK